MATIAIPQSKTGALNINKSYFVGFNKSAVVSSVLVGLFILYFLIPHVGILRILFSSSILFVIIVPILAFALSIISLRQIIRTHTRGVVLGSFALIVTSLYFTIALATPLILLIFYFVYSYLLK